MCICVCMRVLACVCVHMCGCASLHVRVCVRAYACTTRACTRVYACTRACARSFSPSLWHVCVCVHARRGTHAALASLAPASASAISSTTPPGRATSTAEAPRASAGMPSARARAAYAAAAPGAPDITRRLRAKAPGVDAEKAARCAASMAFWRVCVWAYVHACV